MTSSSIDLLRYSDAVETQRPGLSTTMSIQVPVGVEGSSAFHLEADRHLLKGAGERVDQGLVLVDHPIDDTIAHAACWRPSHRSRGTS